MYCAEILAELERRRISGVAFSKMVGGSQSQSRLLARRLDHESRSGVTGASSKCA